MIPRRALAAFSPLLVNNARADRVVPNANEPALERILSDPVSIAATADALRHLPVPVEELQLLRKPLYTYGGPGPDM